MNTYIKRGISFFLLGAFFVNSIIPSSYAQSLANPALGLTGLSAPGTMLLPSAAFSPPMITGMTIHPENPLQFDFIVDTGDDRLQGEALKQESQKLINYFMATLTVPEDEMWVNLSPYEKDRIIADGLSKTEMGRDMLVQDYLLKQLAASLLYPEGKVGQEFWQRVYTMAQQTLGTAEIPTDFFNKVWIVPQDAAVYVNGNNVFVTQSHLKVMLEEDYLLAVSQQSPVTSEKTGDRRSPEIALRFRGLNPGKAEPSTGLATGDDKETTKVSTQVIKEILIPEIEREVNEGKNFANLRQIYNSMILATWYKKKLKHSLLEQIYLDQNKTNGLELEDKTIKERIYYQYLDAFKKGVYDYIKEDYDAQTQEVVPRKYFSGGLVKPDHVADQAMLPAGYLVEAERNPDVFVRVNAEPLSEKAGDQAMLASKVDSVFEAAGSESITLVPGELRTWINYMKLPDVNANHIFDVAIIFKHNETFASAVLELAEAIENRSKTTGKEGAITEAKALITAKENGGAEHSIPETPGILGPPKAESVYSMKFASPDIAIEVLSAFSILGNKNIRRDELREALVLLKEYLMFDKEDEDEERTLLAKDDNLTMYLAKQGYLLALLEELEEMMNVLNIPPREDDDVAARSRRLLVGHEVIKGDLLESIRERMNPLLKELAAVVLIFKATTTWDLQFTQRDIDTYLVYRNADSDFQAPVNRLIQRVGQALKLPRPLITTIKDLTVVRRMPSKLPGDLQRQLDDFRSLLAAKNDLTSLIYFNPVYLNRIHELADSIVSETGNLNEFGGFDPMAARPLVNVLTLPDAMDLKDTSSQVAVAQAILRGIISLLVSDKEAGVSLETIDPEVMNIMLDGVKIFIDPQATEFRSSYSAEFIRLAGDVPKAMQLIGNILLEHNYSVHLKNLEVFQKEFSRLAAMRFQGNPANDLINRGNRYGYAKRQRWHWWFHWRKIFKRKIEMTRKAREEAAAISPEQARIDRESARNSTLRMQRMGKIMLAISQSSLGEFLRENDILEPYKLRAEAITFLSDDSWDRTNRLLDPNGLHIRRENALNLLRVNQKFVLYDLGEKFYLIGPADAVEPDAAMLASEDMGVKLAARLLFVAATCFGCGEGEQSLEPAKGTDGAVERVLSSRRLGNAPAIVHQLQSDHLDTRLQAIEGLSNVYFNSPEEYVNVSLVLIDRYSVYPDFDGDEHLGAERALLDLLKDAINSGRLESIPSAIVRALIHKDGDPDYSGHSDTLIGLLGIHYESVMQVIEEFVYGNQLSSNDLLVIRKLLPQYPDAIWNLLQNKYPHLNLDYFSGVVRLSGLTNYDIYPVKKIDLQSAEFKALAEDAKKFLGSVRSEGQDYLKSLFIDPPPAERDLNYANFAMAVALTLYDQIDLNDAGSFSRAAFTFIALSSINNTYGNIGSSGAWIGVPFIEKVTEVEDFILNLAHEIGHQYTESVLDLLDWDAFDLTHQTISEFIADTIAFTVTDEQHVRGFLTEEDSCPNCDLLAEDDYTKSDEKHVSARMFNMKLLLSGHEIDWPVMVQALGDLKGAKGISFEDFAEKVLGQYLKRKTGKSLELPKDTGKETRHSLPEGVIWPEGSIWIPSKERIDQIFEHYLGDLDEDQAMLGQNPGGIDFNAKNLNLKEQGQGQEINFSLDSLQNIRPDQVNGILPVIINITPVTNFPLLLGLSQDEKVEHLSNL
jgi:hypothetical protein